MDRSPYATQPPPPVVREVWRVERVFTDGRRELVTLAGEPWEGPEVQALERARVMQAEEPDVQFEVLAVVTTRFASQPSE